MDHDVYGVDDVYNGMAATELTELHAVAWQKSLRQQLAGQLRGVRPAARR